jgi:DNA replication protein DnaC
MALEVPLLYKNATVDSFRVDAASPEDAKVKARVVQCARRYLGMWDTRQSDDLEFPQIVVFTGEPGTGKGHIAWSIARAVAVDHGDTVKFTVLSDCIRDLRAAWSQNRGEGPSEVARLAEYRRPQLLIIDEVSEHAFHGEASQHLYDLVAWREQRLLPTILTTNAPKAELGRVLGPALVSRAAGWSGVWEFGAEDYRITLKKARRAQGTI